MRERVNIRSLIWFALTLVAAAVVGRIVGGWLIERLVEPMQYEYVVDKYGALATQLSDRYGDTGTDDVNRIAEEVYREYSAEISIYEFDSDWFGVSMFDSEMRHDVNLEEDGAVITVYRNDGTAIDIGPMPGTWFIALLPVFIDFAFPMAAILLVLYLRLKPVERRVEELLGVPIPGIGVNDPPGSRSLFERLVHEHRALRARVTELTKETERRLDNQRDFLHGVAHEFRGPLARLRFAADLDDETAAPAIEEIIQDMEELVTEILQYSRYHHGLFEPEYSSVLPLDLVREAVSRIQPMPSQLEVTVSEDLQLIPPVVLDEALYLRCILNLLLNACRFCKARIDINGFLTDNSFVLNVDDDGPGIPPGKTDLIFEPFTRLDPSRSRESGGAGLGLAIVAGIVWRLGGTVSAGDGPLGGARFSVAIPTDPAAGLDFDA